MNDVNENLCTTVVTKMSAVERLSQVSQLVSQCQVSQCSPDELSQVLPFCDQILSEMRRIVSDYQQQTAVIDTNAQLWWDSSQDPEPSSDVSSECSSSSISSSLFELSPASPMFQSIDVGDLFVSSLTEFIENVAPNSVYFPAKARTFMKKKRKQRLRKMISRELWSVYQNWEEIVTPKRAKRVPEVSVNVPHVDWSKVNRKMLNNIPTPVPMPKHGCSQEPSFYEPYEVLQKHEFYNTEHMVTCPSKHCQELPFGSEFGVETSAGVILAKDIKIAGHVWSDAKEKWIIHAEFQPGIQEDRRVKNRDVRGQQRCQRRKRG